MNVMNRTVVFLLLLGMLPGALGLAVRVGAAAEPARVAVSGRVTDEAGVGVAGASVQLHDQEQLRSARNPIVAVTDDNGRFSASMLPTSRVLLAASHPDFGQQWADLAGLTAPASQWSGPMPEASVQLVLRRGVVLRGCTVDANAGNRPFANDKILLIPDYQGSGPPTMEAATDARGCFQFERVALSSFELVPRSLDQWFVKFAPDRAKAGDYLRIAQTPESWLATAQVGGSVNLQVEHYQLVPVSMDVSVLKAASVQVLWKRRGANDSQGMAGEFAVDATGTVQILLEQGVEHELWVVPVVGANRTNPWKQGLQRNWLVTPGGPLKLTLTGGSTPP